MTAMRESYVNMAADLLKSLSFISTRLIQTAAV